MNVEDVSDFIVVPTVGNAWLRSASLACATHCGTAAPMTSTAVAGVTDKPEPLCPCLALQASPASWGRLQRLEAVTRQNQLQPYLAAFVARQEHAAKQRLQASPVQ
ncbi:hypothetical protein MRX96_047717 [Rhipicephalus microplus]